MSQEFGIPGAVNVIREIRLTTGEYQLKGRCYGGILIPCILLPSPIDISWSPPILSTFHLNSAGEGRSQCLSYCSFRPLLGPIPITFSHPHYLRPWYFFLWLVLTYFHFIIFEQKLQGLTVILKLFMLFDLEIFKNIFKFLFSRNILKRFSIFEFQEASSLCESWKKDI